MINTLSTQIPDPCIVSSKQTIPQWKRDVKTIPERIECKAEERNTLILWHLLWTILHSSVILSCRMSEITIVRKIHVTLQLFMVSKNKLKKQKDDGDIGERG